MAAEACARARKFVPSFAVPFHKGQHGRVVVIGGSLEYSGAPCYAAMAALRTGADLAWVICAPEAASAIKAFSPELIVIPGLPSAEENERVSQLPQAARDVAAASASRSLLELVHATRPSAVVVGPGLGRGAAVQAAISLAIEGLRPDAAGVGAALVLDADALWAVACRPSIVRGNRRVVITPNAPEAARITAAVEAEAESGAAPGAPQAAAEAARLGSAVEGGAMALSRALGGGVTVVIKGEEDMIARAPEAAGTASAETAGAGEAVDGEAFTVAQAGSPRRCGGQGDVLAGALGALASWAGDDLTGASAAASAVVRDAARSAFAKHRRATVTPDILSELGLAFERILPDTLGVEPERVA